ncbi:glycoside hydrolase superfamily [Cladorrhinum sp. PSN259]|nr:glycoside hydrolase superfamily [Cladorrhinum sp. PSN259]
MSYFILILGGLLSGLAASHTGNPNYHHLDRQAIAPGDRHHKPKILLDNAAASETWIPHVILYVDTDHVASATPAYIRTSITSILVQPTSTTPAAPPAPPLPHRQLDDAAADPITGVTYSPYNGDGTCRTASQVYADFQRLSLLNVDLVRIYGVDCNQVAAVVPAAHSIGVKLFLGIFDLNDLDSQVWTLVSAIEQFSEEGWGIVDTISVGNELVNNGQATAGQVIGAVTAARDMLRSAGYAGPVVTVDTFLAVEREPGLCDAGDYCAVNVHPFFDSATTAEGAGVFVLRKVMDVKEVLADPSKRVVVTESGWPWQGMANGAAVPGRSEQKVALESIKQAWRDSQWGGLYLFTAFDDSWKVAEPVTFYAEQFWGME